MIVMTVCDNSGDIHGYHHDDGVGEDKDYDDINGGWVVIVVVVVIVMMKMILCMILANFMSTWHKLQSSERSEPHLRKYLFKIKLQASLWGIFLISD